MRYDDKWVERTLSSLSLEEKIGQVLMPAQFDWSEATVGHMEQEIARLGGNYAHVLTESVDSKRNDVTNEAWLHGSFTYVIYRQPAKA